MGQQKVANIGEGGREEFASVHSLKRYNKGKECALT